MIGPFRSRVLLRTDGYRLVEHAPGCASLERSRPDSMGDPIWEKSGSWALDFEQGLLAIALAARYDMPCYHEKPPIPKTWNDLTHPPRREPWTELLWMLLGLLAGLVIGALTMVKG